MKMDHNKELLWDYVTREVKEPLTIVSDREGVHPNYKVARKLYLDISEYNMEGDLLNESFNGYFQRIDNTLPVIFTGGKLFKNTNLTVAEIKADDKVVVYNIDKVEHCTSQEGIDIFKVYLTSLLGDESKYLMVMPMYKDIIFRPYYPNNALDSSEWNNTNYQNAIKFIKKEASKGNVFIAKDHELERELVVTKFGDQEVLHLDGCRSAFDNYDYVTNFSYIHTHNVEGSGYISIHWITNIRDGIGYEEHHLEFKVTPKE